MARRAYALSAGGITASPVKMISREGAKARRLASDRQVHLLCDGAAFRNAGKTEPLRGQRALFAFSRLRVNPRNPAAKRRAAGRRAVSSSKAPASSRSSAISSRDIPLDRSARPAVGSASGKEREGQDV